MFRNMNRLVKALIMFVIGCAVMLAVTWIVSLIKGTAFEVNWICILGMGLFIAVMDILIPPEQRRMNREKLMDSFKR